MRALASYVRVVVIVRSAKCTGSTRRCTVGKRQLDCDGWSQQLWGWSGATAGNKLHLGHVQGAHCQWEVVLVWLCLF